MSNLQDVPLAEPEIIPPTDPQNVTGTKSNSLKRFFKLGKKSNSTQDINADACEAVDDEAGKDAAARPRTISRLLTRLKGANKTGDLPAAEPAIESASGSNPPAAEEDGEKPTPEPVPLEVAVPVPNAKPTLKTSISSYWKLLFHRQKSANRQGADADQEPAVATKEMQQQEQQTDPIKAEDAYTVTPATSNVDLELPLQHKLGELKAGHGISQIMEEVQVLSISDEIVDPALEEATEH
ncbi:hypothetical protein KR044_002997 [Drosophila immigrans]|nr:hypothetical protein KR044_002997 [Drosophila immigrans]